MLRFAVALSQVVCTFGALDSTLFLIRTSAYAEHEKALGVALTSDLKADGVPGANIRLLHEAKTFAAYDRWCLLPWANHLYESEADSKMDWFFFGDSNTKVVPRSLSAVLSRRDPAEPHFIGHRLQDQSHAIIHHYFMDKNFGFPHMPAGFVLSRGALAKLGDAIKSSGGLQYDTHIDVVHEFAKYLYDKTDPKIKMEHVENFCSVEGETGNCATFAVSKDTARKDHQLQWSDIVVAIKTTAMFHQGDDKDRTSVIKATWGNDPPCDVIYVSDVVDSNIPTIDIGVNTKKGHCAKTQKILEWFQATRPEKKWFVIADDDTLFYLPRLKAVLNSYDSAEPLYVGERYGYGRLGVSEGGYDYVTMGGGVALSREGLKRKLACRHCSCPSDDMYDDMMMGKWFQSIEINAAHEEGFHQTTPENYHPTRLAQDKPLSFHKFVMDWDGKTESVSLEKTVEVYNKHLVSVHEKPRAEL